MNVFVGKVVFVIGGVMLIGVVVVQDLSCVGVCVVIFDFDVDNGVCVVVLFGEWVLFFVFDIIDDCVIECVVVVIVEWFGVIDVFVNFVCSYVDNGIYVICNDWFVVMDVNVVLVVMFVKVVYLYMVWCGGGVIVNFSLIFVQCV